MRVLVLLLSLYPVLGLSTERTQSSELVGQLGSRSALLVLHATQGADGGWQLTGEYLVLPTLARRFLEGERGPELGVTVLREGTSAIPFGRPAGPPQPPVVFSRNGTDLTLDGETNIRAGTELKVATERPSVELRLSELDKGSWMIFELPGFTTAASGTPLASLDALRQSSITSYYKGKDALWVKLVSTGEGARIAGPGAGGTGIVVSR